MYNFNRKEIIQMLKGSKRDSYKKRKGITTYTGHPLTSREENL